MITESKLNDGNDTTLWNKSNMLTIKVDEMSSINKKRTKYRIQREKSSTLCWEELHDFSVISDQEYLHQQLRYDSSMQYKRRKLTAVCVIRFMLLPTCSTNYIFNAFSKIFHYSILITSPLTATPNPHSFVQVLP